MGPTDELEKKQVCLYTLSADKSRVQDSGEWRCQLTNSFGSASATCSVKILDESEAEYDVPPSFEEKLQNETVTEDTNASFRCKVTGRPVPEVKWYRDDIPVDSEINITSRSTDDGVHTLKIKGVKVRDSAVYKCKITNKVGWASCDAKLFVKETLEEEEEYIPHKKANEYSLVDQIKARRATEAELHNEADTLISGFVDCDTMRKFLIKWKVDDDQILGFPVHLTNKCAVEGCSVVLNCLVKGEAPFRVRWYKNNKEIFDFGKYFIRNNHGILTVEIPRVEESDTGNYMCEVRNDQGKIYTSCYLQVEPVLDLSNEVPIKPMFVKPMKRLTVNEGELIRFRVTVKAHPAPGFKWYKDNLEIHDSGRVTTEVLPKGVAQLVIENATVRDIGLYTCEAHNFAGRARSMVRVSVRDEYELEVWKARSLAAKRASTDGSSIENGSGLNGSSVDMAYIPTTESDVFSREPFLSSKLPKSLTIKDKGRFMLELCCNGCPRPEVTWCKDGKTINDNIRYQFHTLGDWYGLELLGASPGDAGNYSVTIKNRAGEVTSSCDVDMTLPLEHAKDLVTVEEVAENMLVGSNHVAVASRETQPRFDIASIIPSSHLCNTEIDWSANIEKEVEVIDAAESPSFTEMLPDRLTPLENEEKVSLVCKVYGHPLPHVVWFKNGESLAEVTSENLTIIWDTEALTASLVIGKVGVEDNGTYSCVAYSECGGHAITSTNLHIRELSEMVTAIGSDNKMSIPAFVVKLADTQTTVGSELKLECTVKGTPTPDVKWYKNDKLIGSDVDRYTISSTEDRKESLLITDVQMSDADSYRCEAINACGTVSTISHVTVQDINKVGADIEPCFHEGLQSCNFMEGTDVVLKCSAKGKPVPKFIWKKDFQDMKESEKTKILSTDIDSTLTIKNASLEDAGLFICVAENASGKAETCATLKIDKNSELHQQCVRKNEPEISKQDTQEKKQANNEDDDSKLSKKQSNPNKENKTETNTILTDDDKSIEEPASKESDNLVNESTTVTVENDSATTKNNTEIASNSSESKPQTDKSADYKKSPKFLSRPVSQWMSANGPLKLSFEVIRSSEMEVSWFHNNKIVTDGRFKVDVEEIKNQ